MRKKISPKISIDGNINKNILIFALVLLYFITIFLTHPALSRENVEKSACESIPENHASRETCFFPKWSKIHFDQSSINSNSKRNTRINCHHKNSTLTNILCSNDRLKKICGTSGTCIITFLNNQAVLLYLPPSEVIENEEVNLDLPLKEILHSLKFSGSASIIPSSNINEVTYNEYVDLIFGKAKIEKPISSSGVGAYYSLLGESDSFPGWRVNFKGSASSNNSKDSTLIRVSRSFQSQWQLRSISYSVGLEDYAAAYSEVSLKSIHKDNIGLRNLYGINIYIFQNAQNAFNLTYENTSTLQLSSKVTIERSAGLKRSLSKQEGLRFSKAYVSIAVKIDHSSLKPRIWGTMSYKAWDEAADYFPQARRDVKFDFGANFESAPLPNSPFKPSISLSFSSRQSNISLFEYRSANVSFTFRTDF